jgi:hypothetical protein
MADQRQRWLHFRSIAPIASWGAACRRHFLVHATLARACVSFDRMYSIDLAVTPHDDRVRNRAGIVHWGADRTRTVPRPGTKTMRGCGAGSLWSADCAAIGDATPMASAL